MSEILILREIERSESWMDGWALGQRWMDGWVQKDGKSSVVRAALQADSAEGCMVATSADPDRYGDIIELKSLNLKEWRRNPVLLWGHEHGTIIGRAGSIKIQVVRGSDKKEREAVTFVPEFDLGGDPGVDDNPQAKLLARQFKDGFLRTCSIGFIPDWSKSVRRCMLPLEDPLYAEKGILFRGGSIIECSLLPVPANPNAEIISPSA